MASAGAGGDVSSVGEYSHRTPLTNKGSNLKTTTCWFYDPPLKVACTSDEKSIIRVILAI